MLDTVKPTSPAVKIVPGPFRRTSVDRSRRIFFAQYLCTGFGNAYNFILERSSEYTVGVPQSSTKKDELYVYKLFFSLAHVMCFTEIFLIYIFSNYYYVILLLI